jgi:hypothetical protein
MDRQTFFTWTVLAVGVAALVTYIGSSWWRSCGTVPAVVMEGFGGAAQGAGTPDCLRTSSEGAKLYELMTARNTSTDEGPDDLLELQLILSKLGCFKKDLMSPSGIVEATRYQPFATSHDLEPVAETTARCFAKTIPQRDLQLALDKWLSRGAFLIRRLCGAQKMSPAEEAEALRLFDTMVNDVADVALGACCNAPGALIAGATQPRMVEGKEPAENTNLGNYNGYY